MFEFVDRKSERTLALIPGWAFDCRIFSSLELPYNYLLFEADALEQFEDELEKELVHRSIEKVSLFGWSQGAFIAADFAAKNSELVDELILVGARRRYEEGDIKKIESYLKKNAHLWLSRFYKGCFSKYEQGNYRWFMDSLFADYLDRMSPETLIDQLERLARQRIESAVLENVARVTFAHGGEDTIAPVTEAAEIAAQIPGARLVVFEEAGHVPFLRNDFCERLYEQ